MNDTRTIYDLDSTGLASELLGKRITAIDDESGIITLSDGTVLELEDTSDCCAWFEGRLHTIDLTENAITAIREDPKDAKDDWNEALTLTILSLDKEVAAVEIEGNASSGYYCLSINLRVTRPTPEPQP